MIEINYSKSRYKKEVLELIDVTHLSRYIKKVCRNKVVSINYNFVSSREQIKMNSEFKKHKYNTDILTFDISGNECELTGDVYISLKQVKKNSKRYKVTFKEEVNRVVIHGFLHLLGYNDEIKQEKKVMRKQEDKYLKYLKKKCSTWNMSSNHY